MLGVRMSQESSAAKPAWARCGGTSNVYIGSVGLDGGVRSWAGARRIRIRIRIRTGWDDRRDKWRRELCCAARGLEETGAVGGCGADGCDTFLIRGVSSSESATAGSLFLFLFLFLSVGGWFAIGWRASVRPCVCLFGGWVMVRSFGVG